MIKKIPKLYLAYFFLVSTCWLTYMYVYDLLNLLAEHWVVSLTMAFGSLVAGASSEGGGAVAFPVFTLLLDISPQIARNFSFAIQSVGMAAASLLILELGIKIDKKVVALAVLGGGLGLIFGTFFLEGIIGPASLKLFFVSLWVSFGFALFIKNKNRNREVLEEVKFKRYKEMIPLVLFSFLGGSLTSFFGSGVDIFTFCLLTLYYNVSESVATPTSVVIMTAITLLGFFLHLFIVQDFQPIAFEYWLCAVPIVIIFAPIGAYLITLLHRRTIFYILFFIIISQYLVALAVLKPSLERLSFSGAVILLGSIFFLHLGRKGQKKSLHH